MKNWAGNLEYRSSGLERPATLKALQQMVSAATVVKARGSRHCFNEIAHARGKHVSPGLLAGAPEIGTHGSGIANS